MQPQPTETSEFADISELCGKPIEDLTKAFTQADQPSIAELDGLYRGALLTVAGTDNLPKPVQTIFQYVYRNPLNPWIGKRFSSDSSARRVGSNTWLTSFGPDLIGFSCKIERGSMVLDYNVRSNPPGIRQIQGELRRLAPALYLGRMSFRLSTREVPILFFGLDGI